MYYRVNEVSTDKASGHTFVLVEFWLSRATFQRSEPPVLTNDFLMQLRPTGRDLPAEIKANIEAYWERAQARGDTGSKADSRIVRDQSDPHGVLTRADVVALRGAEVDVPEVAAH